MALWSHHPPTMPNKALSLGASSSFKRHPSQNSVIRSSYLNVVPFGTSEVRFKSTYHTAGFLGEEVPVFDIADYYISNDTQNMRIKKPVSAALSLTCSPRLQSSLRRIVRSLTTPSLFSVVMDMRP